MATFLRLGPNRDQVETIEIGTIELTYSLKNIDNYGKRNSSFSKPISILKTPTTDRIFKGLHNIGVINGYNIGAKYYGELIENGIPILIGNLQVVEITPTTYETVLSSNNVSLFEDISDKLIVGNFLPTDDLVFTGTEEELFTHVYDPSTVRSYLQREPSNNGVGLMYPIIDYDNSLTAPEDVEKYPLYPAIAVKQMFDKIFSDAGYSYTMDSSMTYLLNRMYMPFNGTLTGTMADTSYGYYFLGDPSGDYATFYANGSSIPLNNTSWDYNGQAGKPIPYGTIRGYILAFRGISHIPQTAEVNGGYDLITRCPSSQADSYHQTYAGIKLPYAGTYTIDVSLRMYNWSTTLLDTLTFAFKVYSNNTPYPDTSYIIYQNLECPPITNKWISNSQTITITEESDLFIYVISGRYPANQIGNANVHLTFGPESFVKIMLKNMPYASAPTIDLNTIRPLNYKKSDLVNDILKMFNAYIEVDNNDEHLLHITSYPEFNTTGEILDWTNKIDEDSIRFKSIKNEFPNTEFSYTEDNDIYNLDYKSKYPTTFSSKSVLNDSEFVSNTNEVKLVCAPTIMKQLSE